MSNMKEEFFEEEKNLKRLRFIVDFTAAILMQSDLNLVESLALMENTKKEVLEIFPDKESVYDLIYTPRFQKIINERFNSSDLSSCN